MLAVSLALLFAPAVAAFAQNGNTWTIDPIHTQASFVVRHMSVSNVRGAISNINGTITWDPKNPSNDVVNTTLDASTVNTGSDLREKELKGADFFNTAKFPTLTFKSTSVKKVGNKLKITGDLTLAGVTKTVTLDADQPSAPQKGLQGGLVSGLSASTTIKRTDFDFGTKYPNAIVSDEIKITIDLEMVQK
ncbi:MAG TPA: YceI family protein [Edaphobacter sp.]